MNINVNFSKKEKREEPILTLVKKLGKTSSEPYYEGTINGFKVRGLFSKFETTKNGKTAAKLRVYLINSEGQKSDESIIGLWDHISKKGELYYSGTDNENNKVVAFVDSKTEDINIYNSKERA